ncbi:DUF4124 domain-containing protein [Dyella jejuensis]|uniref:DUF4124 domain-containing protein n=1 Tax=Dyella jejuensis TaxID=1432009 RepID=A0ABW8JJV7_9GAMM
MRSSIALVLLLVAPLACAQVYKWTDAQGTTHYSEAPPPPGTKYSQVTVSGDDQPAAASAGSSDASSPAAAQASGNASQPSVPDTPQNRAKLCASLKANVGALQGNGPVVMQGPGGQQQLLNADQRKQQLDASQSQFNQYCANSQ